MSGWIYLFAVVSINFNIIVGGSEKKERSEWQKQ